jgi:hypothetical protein
MGHDTLGLERKQCEVGNVWPKGKRQAIGLDIAAQWDCTFLQAGGRAFCHGSGRATDDVTQALVAPKPAPWIR